MNWKESSFYFCISSSHTDYVPVLWQVQVLCSINNFMRLTNEDRIAKLEITLSRRAEKEIEIFTNYSCRKDSTDLLSVYWHIHHLTTILEAVRSSSTFEKHLAVGKALMFSLDEKHGQISYKVPPPTWTFIFNQMLELTKYSASRGGDLE